MGEYRAPPITEAVIEMRVGAPVPDDQVDKAANAIRKRYSSAQELREFKFVIGEPQTTSVRVGHRLSMPNGAFIAQPRRQGLAFSCMAPYPGWTAFTAEFRTVWAKWIKATGSRKIDRIGVRFINRIDVPFGGDDPLDSDEYLKVGVRLPKSSGNVAMAWSIGAECPVEDSRFSVVVRAGTAESALLDYASFNLDLDLHYMVDLPQTHADILSLLDEVQSTKNRVFEECITDRTRALLA
jgi:uncharacterized protein (TIGR04255 family)